MSSVNVEGKRVQPPRQAKMELGELTLWRPSVPEKSEIKRQDVWWQVERIKRYGVLFNEAVKMWQSSSKHFRQFFIDGKIDYQPWSINVVDAKTIPHSNITEKSIQKIITYHKRISSDFEKLERFLVFWQVMTGNTLPRFGTNTILFRGIKYDTHDQFMKENYAVENILTNWTSHQYTGSMFAGKELLQCLFPKGTKYLFTGFGEYNEFEYIIPGGRFVVAKSPYIAKLSPSEFVRFVPLLYQNQYQTFEWPSKSISPTTRKNYQSSINQILAVRFIELFHEDKKDFKDIQTEISKLSNIYEYEKAINFETLRIALQKIPNGDNKDQLLYKAWTDATKQIVSKAIPATSVPAAIDIKIGPVVNFGINVQPTVATIVMPLNVQPISASIITPSTVTPMTLNGGGTGRWRMFHPNHFFLNGYHRGPRFKPFTKTVPG